MKLSVKGVALTAGVLWGASILLVGVLNLVWPGYGEAFLDLARSLYPGYEATAGFGGVIVGMLYGTVDGFVCGAVFGLVYNYFAAADRRRAGSAQAV